MMLKAGPPRSDSARPPVIETCTSAEFDMSYMYPETPAPKLGVPTFMPSIWITPSLPRPPRELKKFVVGCALELNPVA
jgi:hypothetical protein